MKGIRRSLNKDRIGTPTPTYSTRSTSGYPSVNAAQQQQQKQQQGVGTSKQGSQQMPVAPPKRVIRALRGYKARNAQELSFDEGDFFHVVSDIGGDDWFDAANPLTGARGLVPASHFQVLGRNAKETAAGPRSTAASTSTTSPIYPGKGGAFTSTASGPTRSGSAGDVSSPTTTTTTTSSSSRPTSSKPKSQPLYGVVQYDFVAERADELDAKRGEPIIVIAQSNHEWFVAKPIGRLGGPGLIPVAFVEIQDVTTGKPVENVQELIRSAVVPKVEEWKKMTADYKSASIPLGRFDFAEQPKSQASANDANLASGHGSTYPQTQSGDNSQYNSPTEERFAANGEAGYDGQADGEREVSYEEARDHYGLVVSASIESFHQEDGSYWFHMRAYFSTGTSLVLYRLYSDFHEFQMSLMDEFPVEAGYEPAMPDGPLRRTLPMMPGPTDYEDEVICAQRVHDLSIYLAEICELPDHIRLSPVLYQFLLPRPGDVEVPSESYEQRPSVAAAAGAGEPPYGDVADYLDTVGGQEDYRDDDHLAQGMSNIALRSPAESDSSPAHTGGRSSRQSQQRRSGLSSTPAHDNLPPMGTANLNVPFIKIKTFHRNTDDLIAIRVPPTVKYEPLVDKIRERLGSDVTTIRFREEVGSSTSSSSNTSSALYGNGGAARPIVMAGGARLVPITNDHELERWIRSGVKLVLYAD